MPESPQRTGDAWPWWHGERLSWSISLYMALRDQLDDFARARAVIRAMQATRPASLAQERQRLLRAALTLSTGHHAVRALRLIADTLGDAEDAARWQRWASLTADAEALRLQTRLPRRFGPSHADARAAQTYDALMRRRAATPEASP